MLRLHKTYLILTLLILAVEIYIALFVHDHIIRPYVGDLLVVILLYCLLKSILRVSTAAAAVGVLLFAYAVEGLQYAGIVEKLGFKENQSATVIIGVSFEWMDMLMYTLGIGLVLVAEHFINAKSHE
jgi:hypothetical protein